MKVGDLVVFVNFDNATGPNEIALQRIFKVVGFSYGLVHIQPVLEGRKRSVFLWRLQSLSEMVAT